LFESPLLRADSAHLPLVQEAMAASVAQGLLAQLPPLQDDVNWHTASDRKRAEILRAPSTISLLWNFFSDRSELSATTASTDDLTDSARISSDNLKAEAKESAALAEAREASAPATKEEVKDASALAEAREASAESGKDDPALARGEELFLRELHVCSGMRVDSISFVYSDGTVNKMTGGLGGREQEPFVLEKGEFLVAIRYISTGWSVRAISFVTNRGRSSQVYGDASAAKLTELKASDMHQVWGVQGLWGFTTRLQERLAPREYIEKASRVGGGWWADKATSSPKARQDATEQAEQAAPSLIPRYEGNACKPWYEMKGSPSSWLSVEEDLPKARREAAERAEALAPTGSKAAPGAGQSYFLRALRQRPSMKRRWTLC